MKTHMVIVDDKYICLVVLPTDHTITLWIEVDGVMRKARLQEMFLPRSTWNTH